MNLFLWQIKYNIYLLYITLYYKYFMTTKKIAHFKHILYWGNDDLMLNDKFYIKIIPRKNM